MNRAKRIVLSLLVAVGVGMAPVSAYAATATQTACGALTNNQNTTCTDTSGSVNVTNVVKLVINILSLVVGVVAVIMIIIGGLKYVTSNGDSNALSSAKNTILYAIVGLVIVAMAQFIVQFVLSNAASTPKKTGYIVGQQQVALVTNVDNVLN